MAITTNEKLFATMNASSDFEDILLLVQQLDLTGESGAIAVRTAMVNAMTANPDMAMSEVKRYLFDIEAEVALT